MANKQDKDLQQTLQAVGVRKKVSRALTESAGRTNGGKQPKTITGTVEKLRTAASELEDRARRSAAAKKAADTRKRKAAKRSAAARKAAKTRSKLT